MYTYFLVLNDYGIRPTSLWGLSILKNNMPNDTDVYDKTAATLTGTEAGYATGCSRYGHTNMFCDPENA
jgi:hypothetical protein